MMHAGAQSGDDEELEAQAVAWIVRVDRGLTPAEQDEFHLWLQTDVHRAAYERGRADWNRLDGLAALQPQPGARPDRHLLRPRRVRLVRSSLFRPLLWAAAAGLVLAAVWWQPAKFGIKSSHWAAASGPERRQLEDGSVMELSRDAVVLVVFSASERRVALERGEAIFFVARNPNRPFVVVANGVEARAVGTAFVVKVAPAAVEVLVTEGKVSVAPGASTPGEAAGLGLPLLESRQRVIVPHGATSEPLQVATLSAAEVDEALAWQRRLLDFTDEPLERIVAEFNRRNGVHLVIGDAALSSLRISASIRSDNLGAFVHLLEAGFGVQAERVDARIVLRVRR